METYNDWFAPILETLQEYIEIFEEETYNAQDIHEYADIQYILSGLHRVELLLQEVGLTAWEENSIDTNTLHLIHRTLSEYHDIFYSEGFLYNNITHPFNEAYHHFQPVLIRPIMTFSSHSKPN